MGSFLSAKMAKLSNILIGFGLALGGGYLIYKIANTAAEVNAFYNQLSINIKPRTIKLDGKILEPLKSKLVIKIDVEFINPTKTSISFQKPYVVLKYKDSELTRSKTSSDIVKIEAEGTSRIQDITFEIPLGDITTINIITDMIRTTGTGVFVDANNSLFKNVTTIFQTLTNNVLTKLLPLLEVSLLIYVGNTPITYSQKLG